MCKAFSCLVVKSGEVKWKFGVHSHSDLVSEFHLSDTTADLEALQFAKVEIAPANGDYLNPDKWVFKIDESITPVWWTPLDEKAAWKAHGQWKRQLNRLIVHKPIVHPFKLKTPRRITKKHLALLREWASVRDSVRASVRDSVRASVRDSVWDSVRASVGASVGASVWDSVWDSVKDSVRASVRDSVWAYTGSFFKLSRKAWRYTDNIKGEDYPFKPCVYLWDAGLVPSFDGKKWRLHGGKDAKVLWEGTL